MAHRCDLLGKIGRYDSTAQGGLIVPAYVTRIGVFPYATQDGRTVRELRHPDQVFESKSLATLAGAPLTVDHPSVPVGPDNWGALAKGHLADDVRADGRYVAAKIRVQDAATVGAVKRGELVELSCGYDCDMVAEQGTYDGEAYDARQTNIRYNHVAIGGTDWGRAGNEVRLRTDSKDGAYTFMDMHLDNASAVVTPGATPTVPDVSALVAAQAAERARADKLQGELDQTKAALAKATLELTAASDPARLDSAVTARIALHADARKVLSDPKIALPADPLALMAAVIFAADPAFKYDSKVHSADYLRGRFESATKSAPAAVADAALAQVQATIAAVHADGAAGLPVAPGFVFGADHNEDPGYQKNLKASRDAWKTPTGAVRGS